jgi:hypothetical protein
LSQDRHQVLKAWIAAILWLIVIAIESTTYLSANNTSKILYPVLHFVFGINHARFEIGISTSARAATLSATPC